VGGHCIPLDPYYLSWKAEQLSFDFTMIKAAGEINDIMPQYIIDRVIKILKAQNKVIKDAQILISGIAYKANIDDYRESPALKIIKLLEERNAKLYYYDPFIEIFKIGELIFETENISKELLEKMDLVIVSTGHSKIDYCFMQRHSKLIFDTCNALKEIKIRDNILLL